LNSKDVLNLELIGLILGLAVQAGVAVWWASGVNSTLNHLEHEVTKTNMKLQK